MSVWLATGVALFITAAALVPLTFSLTVWRQPGEWGQSELHVRWLFGWSLLRRQWAHASVLQQWLQSRRQPASRSPGRQAWRQAASFLLQYVRVQACSLLLRLGLGNMAVTALAVGTLQASLATCAAWLARQRQFAGKRAFVHVAPDYVQSGLAVEIHCIMALRPVHIIAGAGIYVWTYMCWQGQAWLQAWQLRGGRRRWPSIPFRA